MSYAIGVDLGGRRVKVALVTPDGKIVDRQAHHITDEDAAWAGQIKELLHQIIAEQTAKPAYIGLAAPGLAAQDQTAIAFMPGRMAGLEGLNWTNWIDCGISIPVLNDAHAALKGEHWLGAAAGFQNAFMLTLGTGVGGAVLANGQILSGAIGRFGHLGHITLDAAGDLDATNTPGSLEETIGDKSIVRRSNGQYPDTKTLIDDVRRGIRNAEGIWQDSLDKLACGIGSLINVLDPEAVILGGGLIQAGELLFQPLSRYLTKYEWRPGGHQVAVIPAQLGDYAGAIGAAKHGIENG